MNKSLIRGLIITLVCLFAATLVGCAKTTSGEIFRFEVSTLNLTAGKEINVGLIPGVVSSDETVEYVVEIQKEVEETVENDEKATKTKTITVWADASDYLEVVGSEKSAEGKPVSKVNENVVFKAKKEGVVRVTATVMSDKTISNFITVTIEKERLSNITLSIESSVLIVGEKGQATLKTTPESITNDATWKSTNEKVVKINEKGEYTAVGKGQCEIMAISKYDEKMIAKIEIDVQAVIYTIVYLDGEGKEFKKVEVEAGAVIPTMDDVPTIPTGHTFAGWKNGEEEFVAGGVIEGNMEITPSFSPKTYKVKLNLGGKKYFEVNCVYGKVVEKPEGYTDPVQEGKVFVGWYEGGDVNKTQFEFGEEFTTTKVAYKAVFKDASGE